MSKKQIFGLEVQPSLGISWFEPRILVFFGSWYWYWYWNAKYQEYQEQQKCVKSPEISNFSIKIPEKFGFLLMKKK